MGQSETKTTIQGPVHSPAPQRAQQDEILRQQAQQRAAADALLEAPQPLALAQRAPARIGTHFGAVDHEFFQGDQFFGDQSGHALGQQVIQQRRVLAPKLRQQIVIDRRTPAQSAIGRVLLAQAVDRSCRADPLQRRIEPNRQHHPRIGPHGSSPWAEGPRSAGNRVTRLDPIVKLAQIQTFDKRPNQPRPVVVRQLAVQIDHVPAQLCAIRADHPHALTHPHPRTPLMGFYHRGETNPSDVQNFRDWITPSKAGIHFRDGHRPAPV